MQVQMQLRGYPTTVAAANSESPKKLRSMPMSISENPQRMIIKRIDGKISTSPCKPGPVRAEHDGDFHHASAATQGSSSDEQTATHNALNLFQAAAAQVSRT